MMMLRRLAASVALLLCAAAQAEVAVPPLRGHVTDLTGTLDATQATALEQRLADFERRKGSQIAVLIVPTTQPETIEQYGIRVGDAWKLGRKSVDDGAILIVAKDDRSLRIEVGYGLEGALNDVTCKRIIEEVIVPRLRDGRFGDGISEGVDRILGVVSGEPLPPPRPEGRYPGARRPGNPFWVLLIFAWVGAGMLRSVFGRPLGATVAGIGVGVVIWFITGVLLYAAGGAVLGFLLALLGGFPGGGFGGGGLGGGGWRGGISSGGYSGGGGGFGGGGASGKW